LIPAWIRRYWPHAAAIGWFALLAFLYLSPALKDGAQFVPTNIGQSFSPLTHLTSGPLPFHNNINSDIVTNNLPWEIFDWQTARSGELPLWNSLSGTGLPQLFNFQSAPLSLPMLVSYLLPLSWMSLAVIATKLFLAGTGAYLCCRVLGTGGLAATFAGSTFMLGGSFAGWLDWAISGPYVLAGWILAGAILCYRSSGQLRHVLLLALAVAFSFYGGFPETSLLMFLALGTVVGVAGLCQLARRRGISWMGLARVACGLLAGGAFAAPLLLPGLSVLAGAARNGKVADGGLSIHAATLLFTQGYYGLPITGSVAWTNYYETAAYVGVIAIVLALVGAVLSWRKSATIGLVGGAIFCFFSIYELGHAVQDLYTDLGMSSVALQRLQPALELFIALLAGLGLDRLIRGLSTRRARLSLLVSSALVATVVAVLWIGVDSARVPRGSPIIRTSPPLAVLEAVRRSSLVWPSASMALVVVVALGAFLVYRKGARPNAHLICGAAFALVCAQSCFLLFAGVGINSYAHVAYPVTPAVASLERIVGSNLLGLDSGNINCVGKLPKQSGHCGIGVWEHNGFYPETNLAYGVTEFAMHDPLIPTSYFAAWPVSNAAQTNLTAYMFAPDIDSVALARLYGIRYVLALAGEPPPSGMRLVERISGQALYLVPDSERFSFVGGGATKARVISAVHPSDDRYVLTVKTPHAAVLTGRITAFEGWHATADGVGIPVGRSSGDLLSVDVPSGTTEITLYYRPRAFVEGLLLGLIAVGGFVVAAVITYRKRIRKRVRGFGRWKPAG
jgi:Bacterial membrane protein YfhO